MSIISGTPDKCTKNCINDASNCLDKDQECDKMWKNEKDSLHSIAHMKDANSQQ